MMSIGQVASRVGMRASALRYYERLGVPANVTTHDPSGGTSCVDFCGYHWAATVGGQKLFYAVIVDPGACFGCTGTLTAEGGLQSAASHELAEMMTDGDLMGWQDNSQPASCSGNEIGDLCAGEEANIASWDSFDTPVTVQKLWSNKFGECIVGDTIPTIASITPGSGPRAGGTTVTITGARFVPGQTTFSFGWAVATQVSCASSTTCTVVTPPANAALSTRIAVPVTATANGVASSWDGYQDDFWYTCTPQTCQPGQCGSFDDGCGGTISCGCDTGQVCTSNQTCCAPLSPAAQACGSQTCGTASDGCGGSVSCGPACACVPKTCAQLGYACGQVDDGCGHLLSCGGCATGLICSSGACVKPCSTAAQCCTQNGGVWNGRTCE